MGSQRCQSFEPVHVAGHYDIEDDRGRPLAVVALDRLFGAAQNDGVVASLGEEGSQEVAHREVVIDDHHLRFAVAVHVVCRMLPRVRSRFTFVRFSHFGHEALLSNANATAEKMSRD